MFIIGKNAPLLRVNLRSPNIYNLSDKELNFKGNSHKIIQENSIFGYDFSMDMTCFYGNTENAIKLANNKKKKYIIVLNDVPNDKDLERLCKYGVVFHDKHLYTFENGKLRDINDMKFYEFGESNITPQQKKKNNVSKSSEK